MHTPEFFCRPARAESENDDGTPSSINECPLPDAQWIGIYRTNPDHEDPCHELMQKLDAAGNSELVEVSDTDRHDHVYIIQNQE